MGMSSAPYYFMTCSGKIDNLLSPTCPSVSTGGFDEDAVRTAAVAAGWQLDGKGLCPGCSKVTATPKPPRTSKAKADTTSSDGSFPG
jgi:hypothetical protein